MLIKRRREAISKMEIINMNEGLIKVQ